MSLLSPHVRKVAATVAAAAFLSVVAHAQKTASTLVSGASLSAAAPRPVLSQHVPQIVRSGSARRISTLEASEQLQLVLSLPLRNGDALNALLADLYNPASPKYHEWLQPADFDAQFGPTAADYSAVVAWAQANGFDIVARSKNLRVLTIQGSTGLVNRAFHVTETRYHDDVRNRDFRAPDREPTTDLAVPLLAISGLENSNPRVNHMMKSPDANLSRYVAVRDTGIVSSAIASRGVSSTSVRELSGDAENTSAGAVSSGIVRPQLTGSGPSGAFNPSDMRAAYYGSGSLTGAGQSVAIFSYDGYYSSDVALWYQTTGVTPSTVPVTNVLTGGFDGGCELDSACDDGEQVLDILQVQGMAPGLSHIYFYEGLSAVTELNQMVSDNYAAVISSSWGGGDFGPGTAPIFMQMAAQGQTFLNATGDSGAFNGFTYLPPSSDPYVLQVGGTDLTTASAGGAWASETTWVDSGGGFFDPNITIPAWQQTSGVINTSNAGSTTLRNSPDIAAEANFDNTTVINGAFETGYGGTSFATPRMAGYIAMANQQSVSNGTGRLGFLNPLIYQLGLASQATYFHDITTGSKNTAATTYNGVKAAFSAVAGYDDVTGWGSPNGPALLNALVGPNFSLAAGSSAITIARSASATVNLTVVPTNNFSGTPTFAVSGFPSGVTGALSYAGTNAYTLSLTVSSAATIGTATVTVTATYGSITKTASFALTVAKRPGYDFTISATSVSTPANSSINSIVTVMDGAGYSGPVDLSVSGVPAGITTQFGTPSTFSTSNLTFNVSAAAVPGTYPVTVTGNAAGVVVHSTTLTLTIGSPASVLLDGGFEQQSGTIPWVFTSSLGGGYECNEACGYYQHGGSYFAYLNGFGTTDTDALSQTFTIPVVNTATLNFWLLIGTAETTTTVKNDTLTVTATPAGGTATTIATFSNLDRVSPGAYVPHSYDLSAFRGKTVTVTFTGKENSTKATSFLLDDISVITQ